MNELTFTPGTYPEPCFISGYEMTKKSVYMSTFCPWLESTLNRKDFHYCGVCRNSRSNTLIKISEFQHEGMNHIHYVHHCSVCGSIMILPFHEEIE